MPSAALSAAVELEALAARAIMAAALASKASLCNRPAVRYAMILHESTSVHEQSGLLRRKRAASANAKIRRLTVQGAAGSPSSVPSSACGGIVYKTAPMRPRFLSGEVPAPYILIIIYLVVRLAIDASAAFSPLRKSLQSQTAITRGTLASLAEAGCSWFVCYALIKLRVFEPKAVPRQQLMVLAAAFAISLLMAHVSEEWSLGEAEYVGRLLLPSLSLMVCAVETRFFHCDLPSDDRGQLYLAGACVGLTTAQVLIMNNQHTKTADYKLLQHVVLACAVQGSWAMMIFILWLRARQARLTPLQALHRFPPLSPPFFLWLRALNPKL